MRRKTKGWPPERRLRQAQIIRRFRPWEKSTGPRTAAGKARSSRNAFRHGWRSVSGQKYKRTVRDYLRVVRLLTQQMELETKISGFCRPDAVPIIVKVTDLEKGF